MEAVKTTEPLIPSLMKVRAAARAQKIAPKSLGPVRTEMHQMRVCQTYIYSEQTLDLFSRKIKSCFVVRPSSIDDHAMKTASFIDNAFQRGYHRLFLRDIGGDRR